MDEQGTQYKIRERLRHVYHHRVEEQRQRLPSREVEEQRRGFVDISTFSNAPPEKSIFAAEPAVSHATTAAPGRRWTPPPPLTQAKRVASELSPLLYMYQNEICTRNWSKI